MLTPESNRIRCTSSDQAPVLMPRRSAVAMALTAFGSAAFLPLKSPGFAAEKTKHSNKFLARHQGLEVLNSRAKIVVELEGKLQLKHIAADPDTKVTEAKVKAKSTQDYFEKIAFDNSTLVSSARRYVEATAENWIEGKSAKQILRPECSETRLLKNDGTWEQFCENEKLDVRETQLLESPVNTALLEKLLPVEPAKRTSSWTFKNEELAELFNLEAVHKSNLTARISKVESGIATIELEGDIDGTANSVPTKLTVKGNCRAQYQKSCVMITWLGLSVKENRQISRAEPGFEVVARVRLIRAETENQFPATDDELRSLATKEDAGRWLVRFQSPAGGFSLLADRQWSVYRDSREETVLRLIKNNSVVAQCNISELTKLDEGAQLTMEGMQAEIKGSLGERLEEFVLAEEKVTSSKLRLLRCVAAGVVEDVPIQWIYNHISDDSGRRFALIYTLASEMNDKFASSDRLMTSSFELLPQSTDVTAETQVERAASAPEQPSKK